VWRLAVLFVLLLGLAIALLAWPRGEREAPPPRPAPETATPLPPLPALPPPPVEGAVGTYVLRDARKRVVLRLAEDGTFWMQSDPSGGGETRTARGRWRQEEREVVMIYTEVNGAPLPPPGEEERSRLVSGGLRMTPAAGQPGVLLERQDSIVLR
jgi:hypothetical protein